IVRGTTSNQLIRLLKDAGAEEVHMRVGSPQILAPCYMGINMATREELIAADKTTEEIREEIGADSLAYLSIDSIAEALDSDRQDLCLGCVTGEYPYDIEGETTDREVDRPTINEPEPFAADD
ncbi:MAG: amidophosphoribosyltransferase, partial [Halohasta sp.]